MQRRNFLRMLAALPAAVLGAKAVEAGPGGPGVAMPPSEPPTDTVGLCAPMPDGQGWTETYSTSGYAHVEIDGSAWPEPRWTITTGTLGGGHAVWLDRLRTIR